MKVTTEEAFVKTPKLHGIRHVVGIILSAIMPMSGLFPKGGLTFRDYVHKGSADMMADG